jgi:hypothetical protein
MDCQHLFDSMDDEDADTSSGNSAHRATCLRCRRVHGVLERARPVLRSLSAVSPAAGFTDRLEARIARLEATRHRRSRNLRVALGLGSSSALAALLALLAAPDVPAGRERGEAQADPAAAVRIVRPLASVATQSVGGPFSAAAGAHVLDETEHDFGEALPLSAVYGETTVGGSAVTSSNGPRVWPAAMAAAPWATPAPVVFAAPSWSFAAAPAAFSFVSSSASAASIPPLTD